MTDHFIQRRTARAIPWRRSRSGRSSISKPYRGEVVPYYPAAAETAENALYLAVAQVAQKSNLAKACRAWRRRSPARSPRTPQFYVELGQAWLSARQSANAIAQPLKKPPGVSPIRRWSR